MPPQKDEHVVPLTPIHHAYLQAFTKMVTSETLADHKRAQRVMEGTLPWMLAQSGCEHLMDEKPPRGPMPRDRALDRLLQMVLLHP